MAQPDKADQVPADDSSTGEAKVTPFPGVDAVSLNRKAEGGLTLHFALDLPKLPSMKAMPSWTHQQMVNGILIAAVVALAGIIGYQQFLASPAAGPVVAASPNIRPNVKTDSNPTVDLPVIGTGTYIDRAASIIGDVHIGDGAFVAPLVSIRGDEGQPIVIGNKVNVQDGVVLHALETFHAGKMVDKNLVSVGGNQYALFIGDSVSLAPQSQIHGPAAIGDHTYVGMQTLVFRSTIGKNVVLEPRATVIGVTVADGRYVPAGSLVTTQAAADALPKITADYPWAKFNDGILEVNQALAEGYLTPPATAAP